MSVRQCFLLHASCICHEDGAILFTAPSGMGKSTQAQLWNAHRSATVINGDRVVLGVKDGVCMAYGVPFSGTSGIQKQASLPIKAIVYLGKAPKTTINRLTGVRAFRIIWEGVTLQHWNQDDVDNCVSALVKILADVPVYELQCTPDETAVTALENAMKGR